MNPRQTVGEGGLELADWRRIDAACDRFESAWRAGERPDLAAGLAVAAGPARDRLFRELLALELEFRLGRGERPEAAEYDARFPEHLDAVDAAFAQHGLGGRTLRGSRGGGPAGTSAAGGTQTGAELPRARLSPVVLQALRSAGYEVLGELGRGGMGVVYLARRLMLNRLCALKMILAGAHAGAETALRFLAEAETVARLRHPNIVQIYHIGRAGELPFVELEYVAGGSLDKTLDGTPRPPAAAARLVEVLARAIGEAHRRGIVHRDLKPANILLDGPDHPKVADFGLAKVLDSDDGLTKTQAVLGSPSYMAPEQAEGQTRRVGPAADIYALGVILYELLTGRPPFRGATALETLAQVKEAEPVAPSRLQPGLPRDVETICLKCLEKAPSRRYATAEALAEDLRRFAAGESIQARPATAPERAWKWARRRPALAAALGVSGAAVALLLVGALYYNARLAAEVRKARDAERAAVAQRNLALGALNQLVFDVQERLSEAPATRSARQGLLAAAIAGLDQVARGAEAAPPDLSRAVAHQKLGDIFREIGRAADARRQYEQALRLAGDLAAASPDDLAIADCRCRAYFGRGELSLKADQIGEAKRDLRRGVDLAAAIVAAEPRRPGARRALVEGYLQLGRAYGFGHEPAEAEALYRTMHDLAERWVADEPGNARAKDLLATSDRKLADARKLADDPEAARREYRKAIAIGRELRAAEPGNVEFKANLAVALNDLAGVECRLRQWSAAGPLYREAERLLAEWVSADPEDLEAQVRLVHAQADLARWERDESHFAEAAGLFGRALGRLLRLDREGRLEGRPAYKDQYMPALREEIADCEATPDALGNLAVVRARPVREAARLLSIRARALAARDRQPELVATAEALCDLDADAAADLYEQARGLGACLGGLAAGPSARERPALPRRCADRAVAALERAVGLGFKDLRRLEGDGALNALRQHPGYRRLVAHLGGPVPSGDRRGPDR
jgi:eukaryotic-like serine/threonine-protein kinase